MRIDHAFMPSNYDSAEAIGFDLDHDRSHDNQLGMAYAAVLVYDDALTGIERSRIDARLAGDVGWQLAIEQCDRNVRVTLSDGDDTTAIPAAGTLDADGRLTVDLGVGRAPVGFLFDYGNSAVDGGWTQVYPLRMELDLDVDGASGRIGGGLSPGYEDAIIPVVAAYLEASTGELRNTWLGIFDENQDGAITIDEVANSSLVDTMLRPDLDVGADALDPPDRPPVDGMNESFSFAFEIHAIDA